MNPVALPSRFFLFGDKDKKFLRKHQTIWKKNEFGDTKYGCWRNEAII